MNKETAAERRARSATLRAELLQEQALAIRAARKALTRVLENESATPDEVLEAARLLKEISRPY